MKSGLPANKERTVTSLEQVETSSRAALGDLRRMLDLLHGNDSDGVRQPGLDGLDDPHRRQPPRRSHRNLTMDDVIPATLPKSLNLAAYRIVQEILTNALRHGDGTLDLTLTQTADEFRITAGNTTNPQAGTNPGTGRGLDGIRHRVAIFGGSVTIGPPPDAPGTWRHRHHHSAAGVPLTAIRVLLADDHEFFRSGFRNALETQPDLECVGDVGDGQAP